MFEDDALIGHHPTDVLWNMTIAHAVVRGQR
jgi:hypothetical protein